MYSSYDFLTLTSPQSHHSMWLKNIIQVKLKVPSTTGYLTILEMKNFYTDNTISPASMILWDFLTSQRSEVNINTFITRPLFSSYYSNIDLYLKFALCFLLHSVLIDVCNAVELYRVWLTLINEGVSELETTGDLMNKEWRMRGFEVIKWDEIQKVSLMEADPISFCHIFSWSFILRTICSLS